MKGYLGEAVVHQRDTPYKDFTSVEWAMEFISRYGQIDGAHHKQWVLDQVARILHGTEVLIKLATWDNGESEYRISTADDSSQAYKAWVEEMLDRDEAGEAQYDYDDGIAP